MQSDEMVLVAVAFHVHSVPELGKLGEERAGIAVESVFEVVPGEEVRNEQDNGKRDSYGKGITPADEF